MIQGFRLGTATGVEGRENTWVSEKELMFGGLRDDVWLRFAEMVVGVKGLLEERGREGFDFMVRPLHSMWRSARRERLCTPMPMLVSLLRSWNLVQRF